MHKDAVCSLAVIYKTNKMAVLTIILKNKKCKT